MKNINNKKSIKFHDFLKELSYCSNSTNSHLRRLLPPKCEQKLYDAINYAVFSGGKRFRAFLVIQAAKLFEIPVVRALQVASAIEKTKPVLNEVRTETGAEAWDMVTVLLVHLASLHSSERLDKDVIITMLWYMMLQNEDMLDSFLDKKAELLH